MIFAFNLQSSAQMSDGVLIQRCDRELATSAGCLLEEVNLRCPREPVAPPPGPQIANFSRLGLGHRRTKYETRYLASHFHLSELYEHTYVIIITNLSFSEWASLFGATKMSPPC